MTRKYFFHPDQELKLEYKVQSKFGWVEIHNTILKIANSIYNYNLQSESMKSGRSAQTHSMYYIHVQNLNAHI